MADDQVIKFDAVVQKVQTIVDFGLRVTLDLPETAIVAAAQLMALKREGAILHISIFPDKQREQQVIEEDQENGQIQAWTERKSNRATA